jgi:hypothetical protein
MIEKVSEQNNNVNIKRLDSDYQDLIENIKGKTVDHIVANSEESTSSGFDIVFTDGTVLEIYGVKIWLA